MVATCERSPVTTRHTGEGTRAAKAEPLRTHYKRCRVWLIDTSSFTLTKDRRDFEFYIYIAENMKKHLFDE